MTVKLKCFFWEGIAFFRFLKGVPFRVSTDLTGRDRAEEGSLK